jgi:teichuronic acid biosynthesis glycosyltransferase TuaG
MDQQSRIDEEYACTTSILMPALNVQDVLPRALSSLQAQSFDDWEVLIVDDGSKDNTAAVAQEFADADPRIKLIRHYHQRGAAAARNTALENATGRFIAFLDADDLWDESKLARQLDHMHSHDAALSFTGFWRVGTTRKQRITVPATVSYEALLRGNCIGCLTAMYDRATFGSVPMPDLKRRHDFALWLTLLKSTDVAHGLDEPLATYYATSESLSGNKLRATYSTWHMYRRFIGLSRWQAFSCLFAHLSKRIRRG